MWPAMPAARIAPASPGDQARCANSSPRKTPKKLAATARAKAAPVDAAKIAIGERREPVHRDIIRQGGARSGLELAEELKGNWLLGRDLNPRPIG